MREEAVVLEFPSDIKIGLVSFVLAVGVWVDRWKRARGGAGRVVSWKHLVCLVLCSSIFDWPGWMRTAARGGLGQPDDQRADTRGCATRHRHLHARAEPPRGRRGELQQQQQVDSLANTTDGHCLPPPHTRAQEQCLRDFGQQFTTFFLFIFGMPAGRKAFPFLLLALQMSMSHRGIYSSSSFNQPIGNILIR